MAFYRTDRLAAVAVLDYDDVVASLTAGGMAFEYTHQLIPYTISSLPFQSIFTDESTNDPDVAVLVLDLEAVQTNYALNEIPSASAIVEHGRWMQSANQVKSVTHLMKRYLTTRVRASIIAIQQRTDAEGIYDPADNQGPGGISENLVLFDGYLSSISSRSAEEDAELIFEFTHFLSDLISSSAITGDIAASSLDGLSFQPNLSSYLLPNTNPANVGSFISTLVGAGQAALGGGKAVRTDFWGFNRPKTNPAGVDTFGLKGFLQATCNQNLFNWTNIKAFNAINNPDCNLAAGTKNTAALSAINRIEPFTKTGLSASASAQYFETLGNQLETLDGSLGIGIDRSMLLTNENFQDTGVLNKVGYVYGMPIPLSNAAAIVTRFNPGIGFAADIAAETATTLGPTTLWDKLITQYLARYGMVLAPMSTRAVILPFCPTIPNYKSWQTILASEYFSIDGKFETPVPVRGAILVGGLSGWSGVAGAGDDITRSQPWEHLHAIFDTCTPGQWVIRRAPSWLTNLNNPNAAGAGRILTNVRASATDPIQGKKDRDRALTQLGVVTVLGIPITLNGKPPAIVAADNAVGLTANRLAKSVYQEHKLRNRTLTLSGRFRLDIGPGSTVNVEVSDDKWVQVGFGVNLPDEWALQDQLLPLPTHFVTGVVTRVSVTMDCRSENYSTNFEIGFLRTQGESQANSPLTSEKHPYWSTLVYGVPLVDSYAMRFTLGNLARLPQADLILPPQEEEEEEEEE